MDIEGVAAIVTGAGSGMGAATARALAKAGAKVALLGRRLDKLEEVASETGGLAIVCDVSSAESGEAAVAAARAQHGTARILVNAAGISHYAPLVIDGRPCPLEDIERYIRINLTGSLNMTRLVAADLFHVPRLANGSRGVIILVSSTGGIDGPGGCIGYIASKSGVIGATLPLARELGDLGVRVVGIAPGGFDTPMFAGYEGFLAPRTPFPKRTGRPAEMADLTLHLCRNEYINGEVIRIDGGFRNPYETVREIT